MVDVGDEITYLGPCNGLFHIRGMGLLAMMGIPIDGTDVFDACKVKLTWIYVENHPNISPKIVFQVQDLVEFAQMGNIWLMSTRLIRRQMR